MPLRGGPSAELATSQVMKLISNKIREVDCFFNAVVGVQRNKVVRAAAGSFTRTRTSCSAAVSAVQAFSVEADVESLFWHTWYATRRVACISAAGPLCLQVLLVAAPRVLRRPGLRRAGGATLAGSCARSPRPLCGERVRGGGGGGVLASTTARTTLRVGEGCSAASLRVPGACAGAAGAQSTFGPVAGGAAGDISEDAFGADVDSEVEEERRRRTLSSPTRRPTWTRSLPASDEEGDADSEDSESSARRPACQLLGLLHEWTTVHAQRREYVARGEERDRATPTRKTRSGLTCALGAMTWGFCLALER